MSRGGFANRQVVILMIQACPPPRPACFIDDKTWKSWLIDAHLTGQRVVRVIEHGKNQDGRRATSRRLLPTEQIPYCAECTADHQRAMEREDKCVPNLGSNQRKKMDMENYIKVLQHDLAVAIERNVTLEKQLKACQAESEQQQNGALLYLTAVVGRAVAHGSTMTMSRADMEEAMSLVLERGDTPDGGLALRVYKETPPAADEPSLILPLSPVLARAEWPIILLDTSRAQGE